MDRYWLLTWRTYGSWLPGQAGFVSEFRDADARKVRLNTRGEPCADALPELAAFSAGAMVEGVVRLDAAGAEAVAEQVRETARARKWRLLAWPS